ncbi:MAG TPA: DUF3365 domain-containing protein [Rhodocyclaceae bacterium]
MMRNTLLAAAAALLPLAACAEGGDAYQDMRETAAKMPPKLLGVMQDEIAKGGPVGAISTCRDKAPAMAKSLSEATGMQIRRVSLKNRNPKAAPDAWEREMLEEFDRRAAAGENPATLEAAATVVEDGKPVRRYMKALPTQELCLMCHGTSDTIGQDVAGKLKELYPDDKAVGYHAKEVRGAITVKKPL